MGLTQSTAPTEEVVTLEEAKDHSRIDHNDDDALIRTQIKAARSYVEEIANRQLVNASWTYTLDSFPGEIILPRPPLVSVTSIQYVDTAGSTQTEATSVYTVLTDDDTEGRIVEAVNQTWSATRDQPNAVTIVYVAGYGAAATAVPEGYKAAILLLFAEMYENRETFAVGRILARFPTLDRLMWQRRVVPV